MDEFRTLAFLKKRCAVVRLNPAERLIALRQQAGLSRNQLAQRAGYARGTSLQYYEDPNNWSGRLFPAEFVARIAPVLRAAGIGEKEIWELAEPESTVALSTSAVVLIPVFEWSRLSSGRNALKTTPPIAFIEAVGLEPSDYFAVLAQTDYAAGKVPKGSHFILDRRDIELRDGRRYVIVWNNAPTVRCYYSNPARFESDAVPAEATIFPSGPVEIIGRVIRAVIAF